MIATTLNVYRQYIEKDGALERHFQNVLVEPTTIEILHNKKDKYETHHNVSYTNEALEACVKLTNRYMTKCFLRDKVIDALDEACRFMGSLQTSYDNIIMWIFILNEYLNTKNYYSLQS